MAAFPEFFAAWVATQTDLAALVGTRVTPWQATRADPGPRITYTLVSGERINRLLGPATIARQRWQVDCWGPTPAVARQVAALVAGTGDKGDQRLDGYRGRLAGVAVVIMRCSLVDERDNSESLTPDGRDAGSPCVSLDFAVDWKPFV